MNRRSLTAVLAGSMSIAGCLDRSSEADNGSTEREEFEGIPDSCSESNGMFQMNIVNNTNTDRDVSFSLFHNDTEFLFQRVSLGPENGGSDNGETIRGISCFGEQYRLEIDVEGYQTDEHTFFAEEGGFFTIAINSDELFIIYTLGD
ncbi:hypothetical protein [Halorubrum amylolyticum]|uniref:hypothetical protein n=1 Tax=Halorubrum amylolyticum TaxID=2508724 RepID=UPI0010090FEF|nr:hypothetical protein [Halorubrum amylolyticum]